MWFFLGRKKGHVMDETKSLISPDKKEQFDPKKREKGAIEKAQSKDVMAQGMCSP